MHLSCESQFLSYMVEMLLILSLSLETQIVTVDPRIFFRIRGPFGDRHGPPKLHVNYSESFYSEVFCARVRGKQKVDWREMRGEVFSKGDHFRSVRFFQFSLFKTSVKSGQVSLYAWPP